MPFRFARLAADKGFVGFDNLICTAERAGIEMPRSRHRLADAMPEEPRGFQPASEGALKLAGRDALFRRTEQVDRLQPYPHRHMAQLEHGADFDGERLAAGVALIKTDAVGLSLQPADMFLGRAAMRANRTIGPQPRLGELVGGFFAMEMCGRKGGFAWPISLTMLNLAIAYGNVK